MTTELSSSPTLRQRWSSFRLRDWLHSLISPGDSAHELALGAAIGVFVGFTPLFGLHIVIILFVAFVLQRFVRFNKVVAIAACHVNNPITFAPILWGGYKVGVWLFPFAANAIPSGQLPHEFHWRDGIASLPGYLYGLGMPLLIGCFLLGIVMALATYPAIYTVVKWHRKTTPCPRAPASADESSASHIDAPTDRAS